MSHNALRYKNNTSAKIYKAKKDKTYLNMDFLL